MAPRIRSEQLETRTQRARLVPRRKPYSMRIAPGIRLGYRKNEGPGTWSVICADGVGGSWLKRIALADDQADADDKRVMDYWQAQKAALKLAQSSDGDESGERPKTVREAIDDYRVELKAQGGRETNATLLIGKLSPSLASRPVGMVSTRDVLGFRNALIATGIKNTTTTRYLNSFLAALRFAAQVDKRITNANDWKLESLQDDGEARNVILNAGETAAVVDAAYAYDPAFGLLIETLAQSGARISQAWRLTVDDLPPDLPHRLLMPRSRKGGRRKRSAKERRPIPITATLAAKLKTFASGRPAKAPLFVDGEGSPWKPHSQTLRFHSIAAAAGLDPAVVTVSALRHTSIVRQIMTGTPIRLVAALHDTSVAKIEANYARHIANVGDELARRALADFEQAPTGDNVVTLR